MRTILALCGLTLVGGGYFIWRAMQVPTQYGAFIGAPKASVTELVERPKEFLGKTVAVEGTIRQQCKAMGCFFYLPSGKELLRVDLEPIAMTAPMREGHTARVEGQIAAHGDGYQLVASGVEFN